MKVAPRKRRVSRNDDDYIMDRLLLSDKEKEDIMTALKSVSVVENQNTDTLSKLSAIFNTTSDNWLEVDFSRWGNETHDNLLFQTLKRAILSHQMMNIVYANTYGKINERTICPLKLVYKAKNWYIKAYCMNKSDFRIFKLTRIIRANVIEEFFTPMEFPQEEKEEQKAKYPCITLAFPQSMSYLVYDEFGTDEIQQCDNGDFIVSAIMPVDNWLVGYLLSFGSNVRIIEPEYLKKIVWKEANKICQTHKP